MKITKNLKHADFSYDESAKTFTITGEEGNRVVLNKVYAFAFMRFVVRMAQRNWLRTKKIVDSPSEPMGRLRKRATRRRKPNENIRPDTLTAMTDSILDPQPSSLDIICASDEPEFFYSDSGDIVPEGDPIGFDMDRGNEVELVLFSNVYWSPAY